MSGLVKSCNAKDPVSAQTLTKSFIKMLWQVSEEEYQAYVITDQIVAMKDCIEEVNCKFLNTEEINMMGMKIFEMMKKS